MIRSARIAPGARRVHELRIQLPASCAESGNAVDVFWRQRKGPWQAERLPGLEAAASRFRPRRLSACLHPADLASASLPMPPLARPLLLKAARQAVAARSLNALEELLVAHGPRSEDGRMDLAWTPRQTVRQQAQRLRHFGLSPRALLPPHGRPDLAAGRTVWVDGWALRPVGPQHLDILPPGHPSAGQEAAPGSAFAVAHWHFPLKALTPQSSSRWPRIAAGWAAAALALSLLAVHLDTRRLAARGQALKHDMTQRVKTAFPDMGMVLDPLRQARQQIEARRDGSADAIGDDLFSLIQAAAPVLDIAQGQIQTLAYQPGTLTLTWRDGARPAEARLAALREQASNQRITLTAEQDSLVITAQPAPMESSP